MNQLHACQNFANRNSPLFLSRRISHNEKSNKLRSIIVLIINSKKIKTFKYIMGKTQLFLVYFSAHAVGSEAGY